MMAVAATPDPSAIARALGGAKPYDGGKGWSCKCPAHDDKHASLSLTMRDGRLLWRCHAGCPQDAVQAALAKLGHVSAPRTNGRTYTAPRPVPPAKKAAAAATPIGRIVATYDYVDVTGVLLFQVVRFDPKTFRQRRPVGSGRWEWGLGRVEPVIYRLPEVLKAETVFVVEGEKDADRIVKLGLCGTSSPMGAGKWRPGYGKDLAGKHVVVVPDNDDPGRAHADEVAASAREHGAASVRVVALPKLPEKGDLSDWLDAGHDRGDLEKIVRATPLWGETAEGGDQGWRSRLIAGDRGPVGNEANVALALRAAPELVGRLRFDAFRTAVQLHSMPWDGRPEWRDWLDEDDTHLALWVQERDVNFPSHRMPGVVTAISKGNEYHPVRAYLEGLKWDGTRRIDTWLTYYLGAEAAPDRPGETGLLSAFGVKWLISACARVYQPGCKADCALILEGPQGAGKSSAARLLCGDDWFADQIADLGNKDSCEDLRGKWIIELAELSALRRGADIERVKAFMSRGMDHYRPSYGRRSVDIPRQCVFVGTTNSDAYLHDDTGNRRFWPVRVGSIDRDALKKDRDQLWAEAMHRYRQGEDWWLPREMEEEARQAQSSRVEDDTWSAFIAPYLIGRDEVTTREVIVDCLGKDKKDISRGDETRTGQILRTLGFRSCQRRHHMYGCRIYERVKK